MKPSPPLPTSDEVDRRLRIVSELRNLCLSLGRAGAARDVGTAAAKAAGGLLPKAEPKAKRGDRSFGRLSLASTAGGHVRRLGQDS